MTARAPAFRHVRRGGRYLRVADPSWVRPLDPRYARERGGRWNPPGSFPVVYLFSALDVARSFVLGRFEGHPYDAFDLVPETGPDLVETEVPPERFVDVVTAEGCLAAGLPITYPRDEDGSPIPHERCRPIGERAWDRGEPGIACRSATARRNDSGEELAWFARGPRGLRTRRRRAFAEWWVPLPAKARTGAAPSEDRDELPDPSGG
ncbi:MAG TPA: RES domain-containing protein [Actinomycetota bacterium]